MGEYAEQLGDSFWMMGDSGQKIQNSIHPKEISEPKWEVRV
ncbi:hypothetical protein [Bacillus sp. REN3]|nr:hypothetical protein [Bacillus sp. REN3]